jgi:hypothetical protein
MVYVVAVLMGFLVGINAIVERQIKAFAGCGYSNSTLGTLSTLGGFGGWFCAIPAAYFVGSAWGNGIVDGVIFIVAVFAGAFVSGFFRRSPLNYWLSALTLPANVALVFVVYTLTKRW